jgi:hypothetical protein
VPCVRELDVRRLALEPKLHQYYTKRDICGWQKVTRPRAQANRRSPVGNVFQAVLLRWKAQCASWARLLIRK